MIFNKIRLKNIKSYYGEHEFDLTGPEDKPIYLIGAVNGRGKTTLFEAIRACLFATKSDPILRGTDISRSIEAQEMEVEIEFEQNPFTWRLSRTWTRQRGTSETGVKSVTLTSQLENLTSAEEPIIEEDDEIALMVSIFMPGQIRDFFLFDGERIQDYADSSSENIRDALERLLGLNLYIKLMRDLQNLDGSLRKSRDSHDVGTDLSKATAERDVIGAQIKKFESDRTRMRKSLTESKRDLEILERSEETILQSLDPETQSNRSELTSTRDTLDRDIQEATDDLKGLLGTELPIAWFWPLLKDIPESMLNSGGTYQFDEWAEFLWNNRSLLVPALGKGDFDSFLETLEDVSRKNTSPDFPPTAIDGARELARRLSASKTRVLTVAKNLQEMKTDYDSLGHELNALPTPQAEHTDVQELRQSLEFERNNISRLERDLADTSEKERDYKRQLEALVERIGELSSNDAEYRRLDAQLDACRRLQAVLEDFINEYRSTRVGQLETEFNRQFRNLTNTPGLVERVEIDKDSYDITIVTRAGKRLAALEQSAGQKEVLAFTLISSVVALSDRQLPVVIDTPLARLDSFHKGNILKNFFPNVGKQVIILSTDTEIGREQRQVLQPHIAKEYHLILDTETAQTTVKEGYLVE
ncbi:MAG: DNA sulfur modification protein DndD [Chloroflexi bacterium]|nr:DNA sulfur modification protein DndD [Chloroflexota bacterium]